MVKFLGTGAVKSKARVVSIESVTVRCKIDETVSFETGLNCLSYFTCSTTAATRDARRRPRRSSLHLNWADVIMVSFEG